MENQPFVKGNLVPKMVIFQLAMLVFWGGVEYLVLQVHPQCHFHIHLSLGSKSSGKTTSRKKRAGTSCEFHREDQWILLGKDCIKTPKLNPNGAPLFCLEFRPCFDKLTFKHRGQLGSRYMVSRAVYCMYCHLYDYMLPSPPLLQEPAQRMFLHRKGVGSRGEASDTPLKTNIEPENEPLEEEIPTKNHHFVSFRRGILYIPDGFQTPNPREVLSCHHWTRKKHTESKHREFTSGGLYLEDVWVCLQLL